MKKKLGVLLLSICVFLTSMTGVVADTTPAQPVTNTIHFSLKDSVTEKELEGATLVIKNSKGEVVTSWTTTKTPHDVTLEEGVYTIGETVAPFGYELDATEIHFTVSSTTQNNRTITLHNKEVPAPQIEDCWGTVKVTKKDAATNKALAGATLVLKNSKGEVVETWVSTTKEHVIDKLPAGNYVIVETKSPKGYGLSDEIVNITIPENTKATVEVVVFNSTVPVTADMNMTLIFAGFALSILTFGFGMYKLSKQN